MRVDTFAHEGCEISPYYDSLIAKLMTHGRDRAEAIARMRRCLDVMVVEGIKTNIPLHRRILEDPDFQAGRHRHPLHGALRRRPGRWSPPPPECARLPPAPFVYPILDADALGGRVRGRRWRARWSRAGARLLQLRAKGLGDRALLRAAPGRWSRPRARAARWWS